MGLQKFGLVFWHKKRHFNKGRRGRTPSCWGKVNSSAKVVEGKVLRRCGEFQSPSTAPNYTLHLIKELTTRDQKQNVNEHNFWGRRPFTCSLQAYGLPSLSTLNQPTREIWGEVINFFQYSSVTRGMSVLGRWEYAKTAPKPLNLPFCPIFEHPRHGLLLNSWRFSCSISPGKLQLQHKQSRSKLTIKK